MGKSLTFWSIIIGFLLGFLQQNLYNFAKIIQTDGFLKAMVSINYTILVISVVVAAFVGCLFYLIEREQKKKHQKKQR